ncbi:MAG: 3D domain-containing protein [Planctomycetota bacterium]|nr:MAG: 3D domain-containing protein [Planctomycetota bacterium]
MKNNHKALLDALCRRLSTRASVETGVFVLLVAMTAVSAAMVKEASHLPALASVAQPGADRTNASIIVAANRTPAANTTAAEPTRLEPTPAEAERAERILERKAEQVRWFNGRPVRPARVVWMTVTAYSPDARSCGPFADGITATLHSVETNGGNLVAADTRLFPFGSMLSVEGYDEGNIVPVLDRGGAIKGHHIDLLMPTHKQARQWGVKRMPVVVWEFADGKPMEDPRKFR